MHLVHDCFMSTIGFLYLTAAVSSLNLILIPTACYLHMETQNHTCCNLTYTVFLHFRGTNHIAGSRLSIAKAGVYSKEQDKKKVHLRTYFFENFPGIYHIFFTLTLEISDKTKLHPVLKIPRQKTKTPGEISHY